MSNTLIITIYIFAVYGLSNMMVFGSGPFRIFERIREMSSNINPHFGTLFACMMCFPANVGLLSSFVDWFLLGSIAITPFNLLLAGTNLWWLAILGDCCLTSGAVWIIHNIESFFENIIGGSTDVQQDNNDDVIDVHE